jgi:hypothetical protein
LKTAKRTTFFFLLLAIPVFLVPAQTSSTTTTTNNNFFDLSGAPQWARDLRRFEIVTFGTIPFAMFTATFGMDMYRWYNANGMDFSESGRRYAPWPLKSAGAYAMEPKEIETTLIIAASLCVTVALTDLVITLIKRSKARKRTEALPHNATTINRKPLYEEEPQIQEGEHAAEVRDDSAGDLGTPSPAPSP